MQEMLLELLSLGERWQELFGVAESLPDEKEPLRLTGKASQNLVKELVEMQKDGDTLGMFERIMCFFKV